MASPRETSAAPAAGAAPAAPAAGAAPLSSLLAEFLGQLATGNAAAAAELWDVPALILSDDHAHGPLSLDRLAEMLSDVLKLHDAEPPAAANVCPPGIRIERLHWHGRRVVAVEARWPRLERGGLLQGTSAATFIVRYDEHGQPRIRGLLLHAAEPRPLP